MKETTISLTRAAFTVGLGTKGVRRDLTRTVDLDVTSIPPNVATFIFGWGAERLLQQASQSAERAQVSEWQEDHAKTDKNGKRVLPEAPTASAFPWDVPRLERDAIAAMQARVAEWERGDIGRSANFLSALDRRAASIAEMKVRAALAQAKREASAETVAKGVAVLLAHEVQGPLVRAEAERQLEAERQAAQAPVDDDLMALIGQAA